MVGGSEWLTLDQLIFDPDDAFAFELLQRLRENEEHRMLIRLVSYGPVIPRIPNVLVVYGEDPMSL